MDFLRKSIRISKLDNIRNYVMQGKINNKGRKGTARVVRTRIATCEGGQYKLTIGKNSHEGVDLERMDNITIIEGLSAKV